MKKLNLKTGSAFRFVVLILVKVIGDAFGSPPCIWGFRGGLCSVKAFADSFGFCGRLSYRRRLGSGSKRAVLVGTTAVEIASSAVSLLQALESEWRTVGSAVERVSG